jgi:hypothetical protein
MSSRKSRKAPAAASRPAPAGRPPPAREQRLRPILLGALAFAVGAIAVGWWLGRPAGNAPGGPAGTPEAPAAGAVGPGNACQGTPRFVARLGVGPRALIGTSVPGIKGLAVLDPDKPRDQGGIFQHPTWDDAGALGPYAYDEAGTIYVAPAPLDNVQDNPVERQNKVYRVDTDTMEMRELVDLPAARPPSGANPFGVVGLTYDCGTHRLYASSVAGSTAGQEAGRIFRIDPAGATATVLQDGVDPFGLAVFQGARGPRLYYGLARQPELYSVALDAAGNFADSPRRELSLADEADGTNDKIRRVRFLPGGRMTLHAYDFTYSLQVASEREEKLFDYDYDAASDGWRRVGGKDG